MAVVISKKVGNAVKRNKFKRQMRSLFRRNKDLLESSFDILIIAKKEIIEASWRKLQEDYFAAIRSSYTYEAIKKHGLLKGVFLGGKRLLKCHPFHPGGVDLIP